MRRRTIEGSAGVGAHSGPGYVRIWVVLLALLVVSVMGPMLEVPVVTAITAFGIAIVKAYIVVRYFMHLSVEPKYVGYLLASMVAFVLLFYVGVAPDVQRHEGQQWVNRAAQEEVERALAVARGGSSEAQVAVPEAFDAAQEFATTCGVCHGAGGAGDGPAAAGLDPHPADFTDEAFWASRNRARILRVVSEGGAAVGRSALMPGFGSRYDADQLDALVDHIVALAPEGALGPQEEP
jgi:caa(3)-type oxidase subunit IV